MSSECPNPQCYTYGDHKCGHPDCPKRFATAPGLIAFALPIIIITLISTICAYIAAKRGASRFEVRLLAFPATFFMTNAIGLAVASLGYIALNMMGAGMQYPNGGIFDLTVYAVWGKVIFKFWGSILDWKYDPEGFKPVVPIWHIVVFQAVLWLCIGRHLAKFWTTCIMLVAGRADGGFQTQQ